MKYIFTILAGLFATIANAQSAKYTLNECIEYAIENSHELSIQQSANKIYKYSYQAAIASLLPSVGVSSSASFSFGRGLDANTNTYVDVNSFYNSYTLSASLPLFDGLVNVNKLRMERANQLMGKHQLEMKSDILAYSTIEVFFNVQYYEEVLSLSEEQLLESQLSLKQVERMVEMGLKGIPDLAEIQAKEAADSYNLTRQQNLLRIAIILLKEKMNFPIDEELNIVPYSEPNDNIQKTGLTADQIYQAALLHNPKAQASESAYRVQQLSYKSVKGTLFPSIAVNAGYSTSFSRYMDGSAYISFSDQLKNKRGHYVTASLSIPIFSGLSRSTNVRRSKQQVLIAERENEKTLRLLYSEIEQAVADMNGQADEYVKAQKQANAMQVAHDANKRKYQEGLASALELSTSANRLLSAKVEERYSLLKFYLKQRLVHYYNGVPLFSRTE